MDLEARNGKNLTTDDWQLTTVNCFSRAFKARTLGAVGEHTTTPPRISVIPRRACFPQVRRSRLQVISDRKIPTQAGAALVQRIGRPSDYLSVSRISGEKPPSSARSPPQLFLTTIRMVCPDFTFRSAYLSSAFTTLSTIGNLVPFPMSAIGSVSDQY